ncbi:MAG: DNA polymerase III subunit delta' [Chitinophagaceae bacterium]|nr:MAG: DNA polymerase III subunit delta' [Chitinophagaceae bacterium]
MLFADVIGHQSTKDFLLQAVRQNRLGHALLFQAPEGAGGLPMALAFAQYVVCTDKKDHDACGECGACKRAAQFIHPDIHYSYPVIPRNSGEKPLSTDYIKEWREFISQRPYGNSFDWLQFINAENKQGNIPASECRDILRKFNLKSYESEYKILILWYPEFLSKEGNILLKMIEEPPPQTLFIFVAENTELVLPTILSRTQLVKINPLTAKELKDTLIQRASADEKNATRIAGLAEGNYREALHLLQHDVSDFLEVLKNWLNAIILNKPVQLQNWIDDMAKTGREKQKQFLRYFMMLIEHTIRMQYMNPEQLQFPDEEQKFAKSLYKMADYLQMEQIIPELEDACYHIERNANGKILFHALSIKLQRVFAKQPAI